MIGIIGAMEVEITALRDAMEDTEEKVISGVRFVSGKLMGQEVVTAVCGIGKVFAAISAEAMILNYFPDLIINTGVGGGLKDDMKIGDVAVATALAQHDMDTTPLGDEPGLISGINKVYFDCDEKASKSLAECVEELGGTVHAGVICSGDQFIHTKEQKDFIVSTFSGIACEMEGASIAHVSYVNNTPFAVIRAISDGANEDSFMDYPTFVKMAAEQSVKTVKLFLQKLG